MKIIETHNIAKIYKMGNNIVNALQDIIYDDSQRRICRFYGSVGIGKVDVDEHCGVFGFAYNRNL